MTRTSLDDACDVYLFATTPILTKEHSVAGVATTIITSNIEYNATMDELFDKGRESRE